MTQERMLQIINFDCEAGEVTKEDQLEAYTMFFGLLNVSVKNPDGTYKFLKDIFEEAYKNIML